MWPSLLEDARLFLTGTENVTKVVLLIMLVEEKARGEYTNPATKEKVKCWIARENMFRWPCVQKEEAENSTCDRDHPQAVPMAVSSGDPSRCNDILVPIPPLPPDPMDVDNADVIRSTGSLLETYFLSTGAVNLLFPP